MLRGKTTSSMEKDRLMLELADAHRDVPGAIAVGPEASES